MVRVFGGVRSFYGRKMDSIHWPWELRVQDESGVVQVTRSICITTWSWSSRKK